MHQPGCDRDDVPVGTGVVGAGATGQASLRQRDPPAHVVVYYVIALALYMPHMQAWHREVPRCLLEGIQWLLDPSVAIKAAGRSGISPARTRLGGKPLNELHDAIVMPIAVRAATGAWCGDWRLVSLDGSTLDVADEPANELAFGRPGSRRGGSACPQVRLVALVEKGTHLRFASRMAGCGSGEITLAKAVLGDLRQGMLCLVDRQLFDFVRWRQALDTGADLVWRVERNLRPAMAGRLVSKPHLSERAGPAAQDQHRRLHPACTQTAFQVQVARLG